MATKEQEDKELSNELSANLLIEARSLLGKKENVIITEDNRNAQQKISDELGETSFDLGLGSTEKIYANFLLSKIYSFYNGAKPNKGDEIILKYLSELSDVKGYKNANREYVIQTNIKALDSNQMLKS